MATETIEIDTQIDGWMGGWEPRPLHWLRFRECRYAADILSADASFSISSAAARALHARLRPSEDACDEAYDGDQPESLTASSGNEIWRLRHVHAREGIDFAH